MQASPNNPNYNVYQLDLFRKRLDELKRAADAVENITANAVGVVGDDGHFRSSYNPEKFLIDQQDLLRHNYQATFDRNVEQAEAYNAQAPLVTETPTIAPWQQAMQTVAYNNVDNARMGNNTKADVLRPVVDPWSQTPQIMPLKGTNVLPLPEQDVA